MPSYLKRPDRQSAPDLDAIRQLIASKGKGWAKLQGILPFLRYSFEPYPTQLSISHCLSRIRPATTAAKTLHDLYDSKRKAFRYIGERRERGRKNLGCCPYCGLPGNITLDHYLPRDLKYFPHYSVLEVNLVPACFDCQILKGNFVPLPSAGTRRSRERQRKRLLREPLRQRELATAKRVLRLRKRASDSRASQGLAANELPSQSDRRIVHPYYDRFLAKPVLALRARMDLKRNLSILVRNCTMREQAILRFHLQKLQVERRAAASFKRFQSVVKKSFRERDIQNVSDARVQLDFLLKEAIKRGKSINYLEAVTIRHLCVDDVALLELIDRAREPIPKLVLQSAARRTGAPSGSSFKPIEF